MIIFEDFVLYVALNMGIKYFLMLPFSLLHTAVTKRLLGERIGRNLEKYIPIEIYSRGDDI